MNKWGLFCSHTDYSALGKKIKQRQSFFFANIKNAFYVKLLD